jgi:pimeloyl-ACP methyl ester carboxylesterase
LSSFDAIDSILARLADRSVFPNLAHIVLAGHSAGGQIVQRYAVVGTGTDKLTALGVRVRYVVANPSSYAYFSRERLGRSRSRDAKSLMTGTTA